MRFYTANVLALADPELAEFQPFLRFYYGYDQDIPPAYIEWAFQPFLRFYGTRRAPQAVVAADEVSTLLEILLSRRVWKLSATRVPPVSTLLEILHLVPVMWYLNVLHEVSTLLEILHRHIKSSDAA